jgi:hypothetical protein
MRVRNLSATPADPSIVKSRNIGSRPTSTFEVSDHSKKASFDTEILIDTNVLIQKNYSSREMAQAFAARIFAFLILNPLCENLGGLCSRCGNYYVKKRSSQNVYCSSRSGSASTTATRMNEKWVEQRQNKLLLAEKAVRSWEGSATNTPWKEWIVESSDK